VDHFQIMMEFSGSPVAMTKRWPSPLYKASSLSKAAFDQQERVGLAGSMEEVPSYLKVSACMLASKLYLGSTCRILARFGFAKTYTAHCTERNQN